MKRFMSEDKILKFNQKFPLFDHPHTYINFSPLENALSLIENKSLQSKIDSLEGNEEVTKFYSLVTEMKVAFHLHNKNLYFQFTKDGGNNKASPDFEIENQLGEKFYIEVNTPLKSVPYMIFIERKIKQKYSQRRTWFNFSNRLPIINNYCEAVEIYKSIEHKICKNFSSFFYEDESRQIQFWFKEPRNPYLGFNEKNNKNMIRNFLEESIKNKIIKGNQLKNNLNLSRPNILWSEFGFLSNFNEGILDFGSNFANKIEEQLIEHSLPKDLDCQIISISSLSDSYDFSIQNSFFKPIFLLFINSKSEYKDKIKKILEYILPNINYTYSECLND